MTKFKHIQLSTLILATLVSCVTPAPDSDFTYFGNMGPEHWSEHYNKCSGKQQSPININDVDVINRTYSRMVFKNFNILPSEATLVNNGHTVMVKLSYDESHVPTLANGPLNGHGMYKFQQLHFHWGEDNSVGSEDRINDMQFPMELHLVFSNSKYDSFEEAARHDHGVLVLAAFYEVGNYSSLEYDHLTSSFHQIHESHTDVTIANPMELFSLLTVDLDKYYTYIGSLTTPPCSEDVIWIDYMNPIRISNEVLDRFRALKTSKGTPLNHNFRPVQPLNNREVFRANIVDDNDNIIEPSSHLAGKASRLFKTSSLIGLLIACLAIFRINSFLN